MRQLLAGAKRKGSALTSAPALAAVAFSAVLILLGQAAGAHAALARANSSGPVVVAFTNEGLTPSQAAAPAGLVHLRVENRRTNPGAVTLRVTRESGALLRDIQLPEGLREAATELELTAGSYTLSEVGQPSRSCQLTVQ